MTIIKYIFILKNVNLKIKPVYLFIIDVLDSNLFVYDMTAITIDYSLFTITIDVFFNYISIDAILYLIIFYLLIFYFFTLFTLSLTYYKSIIASSK